MTVIGESERGGSVGHNVDQSPTQGVDEYIPTATEVLAITAAAHAVVVAERP